MSTYSIRLRPQVMSEAESLVRLAILVVILAISGLIGSFSPLAGYLIFFAASFSLIWFGLKRYQGRNLWLLLWFFLLVMIATTNGAASSPLMDRLVGDAATTFSFDGDLTAFSFSTSARLMVSIFLGFLIAFMVVIIPFFLVLAAAAVVVSRWHTGPGNAFFRAFSHLIRRSLGIGHFLVHIKSEDPEGGPEDKARLEVYGGPGWLIIYPGWIVVLQHQGKITRAVDAGSVMLGREEKIKAILPLTTTGGSQTIEHVLTQDKIPLTLTVVHVAQMESANETKARYRKAVKEAEENLQKKQAEQAFQADIEAAQNQLKEAEKKWADLKKEQPIGDEIGQCYGSIAKLVAKKAPKIWDSCKVLVASNMRDIIMTEQFEKLFELNQDHKSLEPRINERKIAEIERIVFEKVKNFRIGDGVVLKFVDISNVDFPQELREKVNEEVETLIEERIQQVKARIEESKAKGKIVEAKARAQARILEGQSEGEARAALFREILRELKQEKSLTQDQITDATLKLISAAASVKEMEDFFKSTASLHQWRPTSGSERKNGAA